MVNGCASGQPDPGSACARDVCTPHRKFWVLQFCVLWRDPCCARHAGHLLGTLCKGMLLCCKEGRLGTTCCYIRLHSVCAAHSRALMCSPNTLAQYTTMTRFITVSCRVRALGMVSPCGPFVLRCGSVLWGLLLGTIALHVGQILPLYCGLCETRRGGGGLKQSKAQGIWSNHPLVTIWGGEMGLGGRRGPKSPGKTAVQRPPHA